MPLVRVVLIMDTDLVPWVKVTLVRELVVSPRVSEVLLTATPLLPKATVVLLQEMQYLPQEMAYLVLRTETRPLVKEVLLEENVVFHSLLESFVDRLAALGLFVPVSAVFSI